MGTKLEPSRSGSLLPGLPLFSPSSTSVDTSRVLFSSLNSCALLHGLEDKFSLPLTCSLSPSETKPQSLLLGSSSGDSDTSSPKSCSSRLSNPAILSIGLSLLFALLSQPTTSEQDFHPLTVFNMESSGDPMSPSTERSR